MTDLDTLHEQAINQITDKMEIRRVRFGLSTIDKMSRQKLLQAHGWDNCKTNTEQLRKAARLRFLADDPNFNIWV